MHKHEETSKKTYLLFYSIDRESARKKRPMHKHEETSTSKNAVSNSPLLRLVFKQAGAHVFCKRKGRYLDSVVGADGEAEADDSADVLSPRSLSCQKKNKFSLREAEVGERCVEASA